MEITNDIKTAVGVAKNLTELAVYAKEARDSIGKVFAHSFQETFSPEEKKEMGVALNILLRISKQGFNYEIEEYLKSIK